MDFALAVLVWLPVLQVNDSDELISGQCRHWGACPCWDSMMSPSRPEMRSIVNMVMASTLAKYSWGPSSLKLRDSVSPFQRKTWGASLRPISVRR
jgi:hypothetical protein